MNRFPHHLSAINQQKTHVTIPSMKHRLLILATALLLAFTRALGHGGVELGPNGGRILEFSKDETLHGEVLLKDGQFTVTLLDKDLSDRVRTSEMDAGPLLGAGYSRLLEEELGRKLRKGPPAVAFYRPPTPAGLFDRRTIPGGLSGWENLGGGGSDDNEPASAGAAK